MTALQHESLSTRKQVTPFDQIREAKKNLQQRTALGITASNRNSEAAELSVLIPSYCR